MWKRIFKYTSGWKPIGFMDLFYHYFICLERKVQVFTEVQEITVIFCKIAQTMQEYGDYRKNKE